MIVFEVGIITGHSQRCLWERYQWIPGRSVSDFVVDKVVIANGWLIRMLSRLFGMAGPWLMALISAATQSCHLHPRHCSEAEEGQGKGVSIVRRWVYAITSGLDEPYGPQRDH